MKKMTLWMASALLIGSLGSLQASDEISDQDCREVLGAFYGKVQAETEFSQKKFKKVLPAVTPVEGGTEFQKGDEGSLRIGKTTKNKKITKSCCRGNEKWTVVKSRTARKDLKGHIPPERALSLEDFDFKKTDGKNDISFLADEKNNLLRVLHAAAIHQTYFPDRMAVNQITGLMKKSWENYETFFKLEAANQTMAKALEEMGEKLGYKEGSRKEKALAALEEVVEDVEACPKLYSGLLSSCHVSEKFFPVTLPTKAAFYQGVWEKVVTKKIRIGSFKEELETYEKSKIDAINNDFNRLKNLCQIIFSTIETDEDARCFMCHELPYLLGKESPFYGNTTSFGFDSLFEEHKKKAYTHPT